MDFFIDQWNYLKLFDKCNSHVPLDYTPIGYDILWMYQNTGGKFRENKIFDVQGMSCGHCVNSIESSVGKINGVDTVKVDLQDGKVDVTFDGSAVEEKAINEVIEAQGYEVV